MESRSLVANASMQLLHEVSPGENELPCRQNLSLFPQTQSVNSPATVLGRSRNAPSRLCIGLTGRKLAIFASSESIILWSMIDPHPEVPARLLKPCPFAVLENGMLG
jgi:hypothetical protein